METHDDDDDDDDDDDTDVALNEDGCVEDFHDSPASIIHWHPCIQPSPLSGSPIHLLLAPPRTQHS